MCRYDDVMKRKKEKEEEKSYNSKYINQKKIQAVDIDLVSRFLQPSNFSCHSEIIGHNRQLVKCLTVTCID